MGLHGHRVVNLCQQF